MGNSVIYTFVLSESIGGAEKRFIELWLYYQQNDNIDIRLVIKNSLYKKMLHTNEGLLLEKFKNKIVFFRCKGNSYANLRRAVESFIQNKKSNNCIFHFILTPIFWVGDKKLRGKIIYTYPSCYLFRNLNWKGSLCVLLAVLFSAKSDILDPRLHRLLQNLFFWKSKRISLTAGSFPSGLYLPKNKIKEKKNWIVFLGRFEESKQIMELINIIPEVSRRIYAAGIKDCSFFILGHGKLENKIVEKIKTDENYKFVDIKVYFEPKPVNVLRYSRIFLSLQRYNNYPSRSLLEAIAQGNIPIATDVGDTRKIVHNSFGYFVKKRFSAIRLAEACIAILRMRTDDFEKKVTVGQNFINKRHSIECSAHYFKKIYSFFPTEFDSP